jgi:hypothetical protein
MDAMAFLASPLWSFWPATPEEEPSLSVTRVPLSWESSTDLRMWTYSTE